MTDELCIIGLAGQYPNSPDVEKLWNQLCFGKDFVTDCPTSRRNFIEEVYPSNNLTFPKAAYLQDIFDFDNEFFNISPNDAEIMDPNQKLFLEVSYQALDNAGLLGEMCDKNIGVFLGISTEYSKKSFQNILFDTNQNKYKNSFVGNLPAMIPARISYYLNLSGPSMLIDTSCSSSISAFDVACKAILNKECKEAVVGGINIFTDPSENSVVKELGIFSDDGKINAFDDNKSGVINGEGCGAIVIKKLSEALKDKDNIYCIIKSSNCNQDGKSFGITAPRMEAQAECIKTAWEQAKIDPLNIKYIEAHGTGTELGDPTEVGAINKAFQEYSGNKQFCGIGSIKTNLGHTIGAAGISGIIKCCLILKNHVIPPSLNFYYPNKNIDFGEASVYVVSELEKLESSVPSICCINSFGITGSNGHVVLEEYRGNNRNISRNNFRKKYLVLFSDVDNDRLIDNLKIFRNYIQANKLDILSLSYSSIFRKRILGKKLLFIVHNVEELYNLIDKYLKEPKFDSKIISFDTENGEYYKFGNTLLQKFIFNDCIDFFSKNYLGVEEMHFIPAFVQKFSRKRFTLEVDRDSQEFFTNSYFPMIKREKIELISQKHAEETLYITSRGCIISSRNITFNILKGVSDEDFMDLDVVDMSPKNIICINDSAQSDNLDYLYDYIEKIIRYLVKNIGKDKIEELYFVGVSRHSALISAVNSLFFGISKNLIYQNPNIMIKCFEVYDDYSISQLTRISNSKKINKISNNFLMYEELSGIKIDGPNKEKNIIRGKRVAIIGGNGRIGRQIIPMMLDDQVKKIYVFHRTITNENIYFDDRVEFKQLNISDFEVTKNIIDFFSKIDIVINLSVDDIRFPLNDFNKLHFKESLNVKVTGTLNLVEVCEKAKVANLLNFSSVMNYTGGTNNLSYIMGNSFIDGLSDNFGGRKNTIVQTINWPEWSNIGISSNISFKDEESLFKKVEPKKGYDFIKEILTQGISRIVYGKINEKSKLLAVVNLMPINLSINVKNKGKEIESENILASFSRENITKIIADIMGYEKIDVSKNFFDLGGDSITALKISSVLSSENITVEPSLLLRSSSLYKFIDQLMEKLDE